MAKISIRFFDDEVLDGAAHELDFDEPDFLVDVDDLGGVENNETAWVPLSAVKWVEMPNLDAQPETPTRKVAIRFLDGEVLRGHIDGALERHRYGIVLNLHAENSGAKARRLGIPFSAIKALFYIREFDGRPKEDQGSPAESYLARRTMAPLLDVLEEMSMLDRLRESGVLSDAEFQHKRTSLLERM